VLGFAMPSLRTTAPITVAIMVYLFVRLRST